MIEIEKLKEILERFNFFTEMAEDVQAFVVHSRPRVLVSSLKSVSDFSILYGIAVRIFFRARRIGIRLSLSASKAFAYIISLLLVSGIIAGAFYITKIYILDKTDREESPISTVHEKEKAKTEDIVLPRKKIRGKRKTATMYRYGVRLFRARNVEKDIAIKATDIVAGELKRLVPGRSVINLRKSVRRVKNVISGSVARLGSRYIITATITESETMRVKFGITERAGSADEVPDACRRLARGMALK